VEPAAIEEGVTRLAQVLDPATAGTTAERPGKAAIIAG
jgi:hypothetical protein